MPSNNCRSRGKGFQSGDWRWSSWRSVRVSGVFTAANDDVEQFVRDWNAFWALTHTAFIQKFVIIGHFIATPTLFILFPPFCILWSGVEWSIKCHSISLHSQISVGFFLATFWFFPHTISVFLFLVLISFHPHALRCPHFLFSLQFLRIPLGIAGKGIFFCVIFSQRKICSRFCLFYSIFLALTFSVEHNLG